MKVGILTFPNSPSYGATLQMRSLYCVLKKMGCDVEVINYRNTFMSQKKHIPHHTRNPLKKFAVFLLDIPRELSFRAFEKQLDFFPCRILSEKDNLKKIADRYDYLICGSDQVWNPRVTGADRNYFFSFCGDNAKKISYAASFGVNELPDAFAQVAKACLEKFSCISVREEQGAKIVSALLNKDCTIVLDPTMLTSNEEWKACEKYTGGLPDRYIARFIFNYDSNVEAQIDALQKKTGLPVVTIGGTLLSKLKKGIFTGPISPEQWLYVLNHAAYVVTDSFHGAAFSIIFQKQLFVSLASATNSRLENLLHMFNLDHRTVDSVLTDEKIDYHMVQKIMDDKRTHSMAFLKKAINLGDIGHE